MRAIISGIYKIKNTQTGERYIGSSNDVHKRLNWHKNRLNKGTHTNYLLQQAWDRCGSDCFEFDLLLKVQEFDLLRQEQVLLNLRPEYNLALVADAPLRGRKFSAEHRAKISAAHKGRPKSRDAVERQAESLRGRKMSLEARAAMSASRKGVKQTPEAIAARAASLKGRVFSEEHRRKIAGSRTGKSMSEEQKALRRVKPSEEIRAKMREGQRRYRERLAAEKLP